MGNPVPSTDEERAKLILGLIRAGIRDKRVLDAMEATPRHLFVPGTFADKAYDDLALPIEFGQTISQPYVVAFMTEALKVGPRDRVLEIGTGSGYQAAVLARLCRRVYTVERFPTLLREARARFEALELHTVVSKIGDGMLGWPEQAPFDRIIVTAAGEEIPQTLVDQLKIGGIMVIPVGRDSDHQVLVRVTKDDTGIRHEDLLPVRFVPLVSGIAREG
ncbi:protein-L-isoaspartate(D-aspartate) O-methyltransferase [Futiania mangrovi]|uniref:Protein-L-isoaspartate O-methyltransferase n=1 Tax=Futiania mangrovi TaxID=2959716 RepID=A0A9J6PAC0_9PROT|nr:protein-L-isoaspartate(D-aspartate) O-methyltransferase [Futiania mangrovii]MCP1335973.1 protein-L-isoaspartate(D-aspartate) O-methyltransferase [Futiania mangrovii]